MATIAQIQANRLNAQNSTGPRSAEGKASSCFNALKHGADARARVIPGENEADLLDVTRQYYGEFCPEGIVETELVDTLVRCHWEKHRAARLEAAVIRALMSKQEDPEHALGASLIADSFGPNVLHKLFRRSQAAHRDWFRAETELRRRQTERQSRPADPDPVAPSETPVRNEPNPTPVPTPAPGPRPPAPASEASPNPQSPTPVFPAPVFPAPGPRPPAPASEASPIPGPRDSQLT